MLVLSDKECAIWLTPFAVKPQWPKLSLHNPLDIFAIGPAKCTAPKWQKIYELLTQKNKRNLYKCSLFLGSGLIHENGNEMEPSKICLIYRNFMGFVCIKCTKR